MNMQQLFHILYSEENVIENMAMIAIWGHFPTRKEETLFCMAPDLFSDPIPPKTDKKLHVRKMKMTDSYTVLILNKRAVFQRAV